MSEKKEKEEILERPENVGKLAQEVSEEQEVAEEVMDNQDQKEIQANQVLLEVTEKLVLKVLKVQEV
jgi:hypothetical protein